MVRPRPPPCLRPLPGSRYLELPTFLFLGNSVVLNIRIKVSELLDSDSDSVQLYMLNNIQILKQFEFYEYILYVFF